MSNFARVTPQGRVTVDVDSLYRAKAAEEDKMSPQLRRFYYGPVLARLAEHTGHTKQELHLILKDRLLLREDGGAAPSLATLNKRDAQRYVDDVIQLAAEYGCIIEDAQAAMRSAPRGNSIGSPSISTTAMRA